MTIDQKKTTMRAVRVHRFGGPEMLQLEEVDLPEPQADEILVRVAASSVNPVDYKTRAGKFPMIGEDSLPWIPGRDFAGTVELVPGEGNPFKAGDEVYGMPAFDRGTYADYIVARATELAHKPTSLDMVEAASVPLAALTAWQGLFDHGGLQAAQKVLIHGGAGGVGHFAIQFAKAKGAIVLTTVGSADLAFARELGADEAIDYRAGRFEDIAHDVDVVLDLIGGETQERSWRVLKQGGILVSALSDPSPEKGAERQARGLRYMARPSAAQLREIAGLIDHMKVRPVISRVFALEEVATAHSTAEGHGNRGKIGLRN